MKLPCVNMINRFSSCHVTTVSAPNLRATDKTALYYRARARTRLVNGLEKTTLINHRLPSGVPDIPSPVTGNGGMTTAVARYLLTNGPGRSDVVKNKKQIIRRRPIREQWFTLKEKKNTLYCLFHALFLFSSLTHDARFYRRKYERFKKNKIKYY